MAYSEYQENVNAVVEAELSQKISIQRQEWDIREQELADKFDAWNRKMTTILKRGKQSWNQAIDNYRDNWITWEKEQDAQEAEIEKQWDEKIKEHFKRKADWEQTIKTKFQETSVRGSLDGLIDDLNNQIISFSANTGVDMDELNKLAEINKALDEIKTQLPTEAEQLNALNKNIKNFKTTLAISEISSSDFLGQIQGDAKAFSAQMKEHSDEMRTVANVKAMEQYKKMLDQFKLQLDDRNERTAKQTRNAAMAQGYVQVGDTFVKKGATAGVYGVVNAYEYFDTENEFIKALSETGVDSVNGEGLVTFLKEKSQIEVTAYFHTQKLAIQGAMNKLMGTGDAGARASSRDEKDIGRIGVWIGGQGNSDLANRTLTEMNKRGLYSRDAYMRDLLANNAMFGGFGQLGSATWRPGEKQILGGFYTQLFWIGGEMGKRDAAHSQGRYTPGPAAAMLNQFNVGLMAANSYKNVELAHALQGKSRGYMWEAQMLGFAKQGGGALAAAASASIPILGPIIGVAIKAAADSIKVNTQTGDRTFKLDEKDKVALGVSLTMALVTLGVSSVADTASDTIESAEALLDVAAKSDQIVSQTKSVISIAQNTVDSMQTIQKGVQLTEQLLNTSVAGIQTDNRGRITGWNADDNFWQSAAGNAIGLGLDISGKFNLSEKSLIGGVSNKALSIGQAYYNGDQNAITSLANPDLGSAGGLLSMATSGHLTLLNQREQVANIRKSIREGYGEDIYAMMAKEGGLPRPLDPLSEKHVMDIFAGAAGLYREKAKAALNKKLFGGDNNTKSIQVGDAGTWVHAAQETQFGESKSSNEVYYEAERRLKELAVNGKNSPDDIKRVIKDMGGNPDYLYSNATSTRYEQRDAAHDRNWEINQKNNIIEKRNAEIRREQAIREAMNKVSVFQFGEGENISIPSSRPRYKDYCPPDFVPTPGIPVDPSYMERFENALDSFYRLDKQGINSRSQFIQNAYNRNFVLGLFTEGQNLLETTLGGLSVGVFKTVAKTGAGIWDAVFHPLDTLSSIPDGVKGMYAYGQKQWDKYVNQDGFNELKKNLGEWGQNVLRMDSTGIETRLKTTARSGEFYGGFLTEAAMLILTGGGAAVKAVRMTKLMKHYGAVRALSKVSKARIMVGKSKGITAASYLGRLKQRAGLKWTGIKNTAIAAGQLARVGYASGKARLGVLAGRMRDPFGLQKTFDSAWDAGFSDYARRAEGSDYEALISHGSIRKGPENKDKTLLRQTLLNMNLDDDLRMELNNLFDRDLWLVGQDQLSPNGLGLQGTRNGRRRILILEELNVLQQAEVLVHELVHLSERRAGMVRNVNTRFGDNVRITGEENTVMLYAAEFNAFRRTKRFVNTNKKYYTRFDDTSLSVNVGINVLSDSAILKKIGELYNLGSLSIKDTNLIVNSFYSHYGNFIQGR